MMKRSRSAALGSDGEDSSHPGQPVSKKVKAKRSKKEKRRKKSDKGQEGTEQIRMKEEEEEEREGEEEERATESEGKISTKTTPIGRQFTLSIALPGSIIDNAQTPELRTYLAGQIARAAAVFNIDEVVVFDESGSTGRSISKRCQRDPNIFLARILQYMETPQYLRKALFPMHPDLKLVGLLNPLDCPHHMRIDEDSDYREGVVLDEPATADGQHGSVVDCGMRKNVQIHKSLEPGMRVTVKLKKSKKMKSVYFKGEAVPPSTPRTVSGTYWGYSVRFAHSLGAVFTESPFEGGYDLSLGTSERGDDIDSFTSIPDFRHLLIVFGGVRGLEYSLECDANLHVSDVSLLFNHYLNTCPRQGSRTIRTEEAIPITLSILRPLILRAGILTE